MLPDIKLRAIIGPNRWSSRPLLQIRAVGLANPKQPLLEPRFAVPLEAWLRKRQMVTDKDKKLTSQSWARQLALLIAALREWAGLDSVEFFFPPKGDVLLFTSSDQSLSRLCFDAAIALCQLTEMPNGLKEEPLDGALETFETHVRNLGFDLPLRRVAAALQKLGVPHRRHSLLDAHYLIGEGRNQIVLDASDTNRTTAMAKAISGNKDLANSLLSAYGFPVARQETIERSGDAWLAAQRVGLPAVIKPRVGNRGQGVTLDVRSQRDALLAFQAAQAIHKEVLVESTLPGDDHRIMVVNDRVIALKREPPSVTGDGVHSIRQLIEKENATRGLERGDLHAIEPNDETDRLLSANNRTLDSVLPAGETQALLMIPNASWPRRDVSDVINSDTRGMLVDATRLIGLDVASIDLRTPDITRSWREVGGGICEVESRSGLWALVRAEGGIVEKFLHHLVVDRPLRIPQIVAIGSGDLHPLDSWVVELASRLRAERGWCSGILTSTGFEIAGHLANIQPLSPARAYLAAIQHPLVDVGLYVTTPDACLANGLGIERADVVIIRDQDLDGEVEKIVRAAGIPVLPWERRDEIERMLGTFDPVQVKSTAQ